MTDSNDMLLDETLDDLADLPTTAPYPPGAHHAKLFIFRKKGKDGKGIRPGAYTVKFEHMAVLELAAPTDNPPKPGDQAMISLYTKKKDGERNEIGEGQLKMILAPLAERLQTTSVNALIEATKDGVEVAIVTGLKKQEAPYADQMTLVKLELV